MHRISERNPELRFHPLNRTAIRALVAQGLSELGLFDTRNLVERSSIWVHIWCSL